MLSTDGDSDRCFATFFYQANSLGFAALLRENFRQFK